MNTRLAHTHLHHHDAPQNIVSGKSADQALRGSQKKMSVSFETHILSRMTALTGAISDFDSGKRFLRDPSGIERPLVDRCESLLRGIREDVQSHIKIVGDARPTQQFDESIEALSSEVWRVVFFSDLELDVEATLEITSVESSIEPQSIGGRLLGGVIPPAAAHPQNQFSDHHCQPQRLQS